MREEEVKSASADRASMRVDGGVCIICGHSHRKARRLPLLRRLVSNDVPHETIHTEFSCLWPDDIAGHRLLARDLAELRRRTP